MKKIFALSAFIALSIFCAHHAVSQIRVEKNYHFTNDTLSFVSFFDYFPFSEKQKCSDAGLFKELIDNLQKTANKEIEAYCAETYEKAVDKGAKKGADIILGMYADNDLYEEWKIIYPAIIDNPVHLVMTPTLISQVKGIDDLKELKGAINSHDHFSDFVREQLKKFDIETLDSSDEMYRKLITGEIDYIFTTYWYGMAEAIKLGVKNMVSFSKRGIWNMPLFIGVSKMSPSRRSLSHYLTEWIGQEELRQKIKDTAFETLKQLAEESTGIVPEEYNLNKSNM